MDRNRKHGIHLQTGDQPIPRKLYVSNGRNTSENLLPTAFAVMRDHKEAV
jgi:hypothetical protein